jgi:hypothetical protein
MTRDELAELWLLSGGPKSRVAYGIGKVKNQGIIESLGGGIFMIFSEQTPSNSPFSGGELEASISSNLELFYWQMIALLIKIHTPSGAIIAHEKSMEYHLRDYSLPDRLVLYTRDTDKRIQIGKYEIHFRTLQSGEKS